eukprot:Gb_03192 [translate_table: standard]
MFLKKIGNIVRLKKINDEAKEIEMFSNHHMAQAIYQQFAFLELLKPFHYVDKALIKTLLCKMVISDVWDILRHLNIEKVQEVKRIIRLMIFVVR